MPYIKKSDREKYNDILRALYNLPEIDTKGDLEFLVFSLMVKYMKTREFRYSTLHDCVYACQHCSDEYRRRFLDERENSAMSTNGDID
jgi:hypothetical protein